MILVVRISGDTNLDSDIRETLNRLRIRRKYASTLIIEKDKIKMGMLKKVKHYVMYSEVEDNLIKKLIEKRGQTLNGKKVDEKQVETILEAIKKGDWKIKKFFRLHPPIGGFKKSTKQTYPAGILGENKNLIKLVEKML